MSNKKRVIDLMGTEGNAFYLLSTANMWGKDIGMSTEERQRLVNEMKSKDYAHLVNVFEETFGDFVELKGKAEVLNG